MQPAVFAPIAIIGRHVTQRSSQQVRTAIDDIDARWDAVNAEYDRILARIRTGNPAHVEEQLRANRDEVRARLSRQRAANDQAAAVLRL